MDAEITQLPKGNWKMGKCCFSSGLGETGSIFKSEQAALALLTGFPKISI